MGEDSDPGSVRVRTSTGEQISIPAPRRGWADKIPLVALLTGIISVAVAAGGVVVQLRTVADKIDEVSRQLSVEVQARGADHDRLVRLEALTQFARSP